MLSFFNREYRVRRLAAHAAGRSFLPYAEAHRRLRMALASAAATGSMPELMHPSEFACGQWGSARNRRGANAKR
jgi:hypothetical protein